MSSTSVDNRYIWLGGEIVHLPEAKINVLAPTAQFGANVFEGIRCYWNAQEKQLYAFRLDTHYKRLQNSIKIFRMKSIYTEEEMRQAFMDTVRRNDYREDIAVRQTVFIDGFSSWSAREPVNMFIAPIPKKRLNLRVQKGLRCGISSWQRISDRNLSPRAKVGANYINSRMAQLEIQESGYDSAIFMNEQGKIAEGPGSCLFLVRDGILITPPVTASILESITRDTVIRLAREQLNYKVVERDIERTELYIADEIFLCGSAMEVTPVIDVDGYIIGDGHCGEYTSKIHQIYLDVVSGKCKEYGEWRTAVY